MTHDEIRATVITLFTRYRVNPEEVYDESHFLDYLLSNPQGRKGLTRNSFAGLRRRNHFFDDVETEFVICFRVNDLEVEYSLARFVDRITELRACPKSSSAALRARRNLRSDWPTVVLFDLALTFLAIMSWKIWWLATIFIIVAIAITSWAAEIAVRSSRHNRRLRKLFDDAFR